MVRNEDNYFDALVNAQEEYLGYLKHPKGTVDNISLQRVDSESGDIGTFSTYWVIINFKDGTSVRVWEKNGPVDTSQIAEEGDEVMVASAMTYQEFDKSPTFGKKKMIQKHWSGPNTDELLYKNQATAICFLT